MTVTMHKQKARLGSASNGRSSPPKSPAAHKLPQPKPTPAKPMRRNAASGKGSRRSARVWSDRWEDWRLAQRARKAAGVGPDPEIPAALQLDEFVTLSMEDFNQRVARVGNTIWEGFRSWRTLLSRPAKGFGPKTELQKELLCTLSLWSEKIDVTCVWFALATVCPDSQNATLTQWVTVMDLAAGCTALEARAFVERVQLDIAVYWYDVASKEVYRLNGGDNPEGILWVPKDDHGCGPAHWLPVHGLNKNKEAVVLVESDAASVLSDQMSLDPILTGCDAEATSSNILPNAVEPVFTTRVDSVRSDFAFASGLALLRPPQFFDCVGDACPPVDEVSELTFWDGPAGIYCPKTRRSAWWSSSLVSWFGCRAVEATEAVLLGTELRPGDYLYEFATIQLMAKSRLSQYASVVMGDVHYPLSIVETWRTCDGRRYFGRRVGEPVTCCDPLTDTLNVFKCRQRVQEVCINPQQHVESALQLEALEAVPPGARVRVAYTMLRNVVPPELVAPLNEARVEHLALKQPLDTEPLSVVRALKTFKDVLDDVGVNTPAFAYKGRHPRSCVNCGCATPLGKYRWRKRICGNCGYQLKNIGHTTIAAWQISRGLTVPTCYPGIIQLPAVELPPPPEKLAQVSLSDDSIFRAQVRDGKLHGGKWLSVQKQDLEKLKGEGFAKTLTLAGIAISGAYPVVSALTPYNQLKAVMCRVFRRHPSLPDGPRSGFWAKAHEMKSVLLPDLDCPPLSFDEWLSTMPSRRRRELARAMVLYQASGWKPQDEWFNAFVKTECLPGFSQCKGPVFLNMGDRPELGPLLTMVDRLIQGPSNKSHCIAGPIIKPKLARLKEQWCVDSPIFYASTTPDKLQAFLNRLVQPARRYFWCDFTMFDTTHSDDSWDFVESFYSSDSVDFAKVLKCWRRPKGRIGPFKYRAPVMNASGRDDTALANGLLNGFATYLSIAAAYRGVSVLQLTAEDLHKTQSDLVLGVCGDDSVFSLPNTTPAGFITAVEDNIKGFGFIPKLGTSDIPEDAVFLGHRPVDSVNGYYWCRTLGRALYKFGWVVTNGLSPVEKDFLAHITGVADMHSRVSRGCPILYEMACKILELRKGAKRSFVRAEDLPYYNFGEHVDGYDVLSLRSLSRAYSKHNVLVTPADFKEVLDQVAQLRALPAVIDHWLLRHMVNVDEV